jgi:hypothetical protein
MTEPNNLAATVFVYRHKTTGEIAAHYIEAAQAKGESPEWDHVATLEPRLWIQCNYAAVEALKGKQ